MPRYVSSRWCVCGAVLSMLVHVKRGINREMIQRFLISVFIICWTSSGRSRHRYRKQSCEAWWYFMALSHMLHKRRIGPSSVLFEESKSAQLPVGWARFGLADRCMKPLSFLNISDWRVLLCNTSWSGHRYTGPGWVHQSSSLPLSIWKGGVWWYSLLVLNLQMWKKAIPQTSPVCFFFFWEMLNSCPKESCPLLNGAEMGFFMNSRGDHSHAQLSLF